MDHRLSAAWEARRILKSHIKFLDRLRAHLIGTDESLKNNAMVTTWVLNEYMQKQLIDDAERKINEITKD